MVKTATPLTTMLKRLLPNKEQLKQHPVIQRFGENIHYSPIWHLNRRSVSKGMSVGMFYSFLPLPFRTVPLILSCVAVRGNLPLAIGCSWLLNFLVMGPVFYFAFELGLALLHQPEPTLALEWDIHSLRDQFIHIWQPLMLGSLFLASIAALISYYAALGFWRIKSIRRWHKRTIIRNAK